jgi:phenylalanyl-tRNA synthetase beta chain
LQVSEFQAVNRDFAFVVSESVEADKILKAVRGADKALITDVGIFDIFRGAAIGDDKKSVGIEITIQPKDKTLTDEEIDTVSQKVIAAVTKATGATLRG